MASQSIIKDTFYKSRLLKSGMNTQHESTKDKEGRGLSEAQLKKGLKDFRKTAAGENHAFITFEYNSGSLESIDSLAQYTYLQNIDVAHNNIRDLGVLSHFRYLVNLKASNNQIGKLLDLKTIPFGLESVDYNSNIIEEIPYLGLHFSLRVLKLNNNKIAKIEGLKDNKSLKILDLSQNLIENIEGLDRLNLTELYLAGNKISELKGLSKLERLRVLDISNNQVTKLKQVAFLVSLRILYSSKNKIKHIRQAQWLQNLAYLENLDFCFNPVQQRRFYRLQILYRLPMLNILDGIQVSSIEVTKSQALYGQDIFARAQIFKDILPDQQFIDRRISISQLIEVESDSDAEQLGFVDRYDEENNKVPSLNKSKDKSLMNSKGSGVSKFSRYSKESSFKV